MTKKLLSLLKLVILIAILPSGNVLADDPGIYEASASQGPDAEMALLLVQLQADIWSDLNDLDAAVGEASHRLSATGLDGEKASEILRALTVNHPQLTEVVALDENGTILLAEPEAYSEAEGADIGGQEHIVRLFQTKNPVLSGVFRAVEGYDSFAMVYPVFTPTGQFLGGISATVMPAEFLGTLIGPRLAKSPYSAFVVQTDTMVLYDPDATQIGKLLDDPVYLPYPELQSVGRTMAAETSGRGSYTFLDTARDKNVTKEVYWTTVGLHGTQWRVAVTRAAD